MDALRRTYGYEPIAFTTNPSYADLTNAIVFCRIDSWLTGRRLVSLPFSDHCEPLLDASSYAPTIISAIKNRLSKAGLHYIEIRPLHEIDTSSLGLSSTNRYCLHQLDLRPTLEVLFKNCHRDSIQRKILRADREDLSYKTGRSEFLLNAFYALLVMTRSRHFIPPQPKRWFRNLVHCFGDAAEIRVAFHHKRPIAAILTLRHKDMEVYKYGCSDPRYHRLGGMQLLIWRTIQKGKQDGLSALDLGRSDLEDSGLITFKDRWHAKRSGMTYLRLLGSDQSKHAYKSGDAIWKKWVARKVFPHLPDLLLRGAGELMYKHIG